ncbi:MAG: hypothetical protein IK082_05140 [Oscillospiraceae bacterium]|nr:hypothetical protein [Oscillospiraceae bacterium]
MRLIDADELIFRLETQDYSSAPDTLEDWTPQDMTKAEIADIDKMPTIDAVPVVHGEWFPYEFCTDGTWDKCSVCGVAHRTRSKYTGYIDGKEYVIQDRMNYCPICGAKMDGERKDDET